MQHQRRRNFVLEEILIERKLQNDDHQSKKLNLSSMLRCSERFIILSCNGVKHIEQNTVGEQDEKAKI